MLSQASREALHRVLTCAKLYKMYEDNIEQDFFQRTVLWSLKNNIIQGFYLCNNVWSFFDNTTQDFYLCNIVSRVSFGTTLHTKNLMQGCLRDSKQHCIRKNPIHCCLNTLGTIIAQVKSPVQYCPRCTQHCIGISSSQSCLNTS